MVSLPRSIAAWPSSLFPDVLKSELEGIAPDALPLQEGCPVAVTRLVRDSAFY